MIGTAIYFIGVITAAAIGITIVTYMRRPMLDILIELCGNEVRARFWVVFSQVMLVLVPVIFAMQSSLEIGTETPLAVQFATQIKWALIGLACSLAALGAVMGKAILVFPQGVPRYFPGEYPPNATESDPVST